MSSLTERQEVVFEVILESIRERGVPPTIREIAKETDISSPNGVMCHVRALEQKGMIVRARNATRGIRVVRWGYPVETCVEYAWAGQENGPAR
jgi:repressor LexA